MGRSFDRLCHLSEVDQRTLEVVARVGPLAS